MSEREHAELLSARCELLDSVTKLLERAYELGYHDGREDAENRHKQHIMKTLAEDMEKNNAHRNTR